ncbi:uncharacterized protein LOC133520749 [Cydia pomonella]|uniref:uncharacterized protein LOC133520749 n=1 Tax=Cydia pomonella TaxID=82600 RepID=UPI002ADE6647|nr:uncharacterized protein LOC133520749 [Cydia pomonella]
MAPDFRLFCLLLICGSIIVHVETKFQKPLHLSKPSKPRYSPPKLLPTYYTPVQKTIWKPPPPKLSTQRSSYPTGGKLSGTNNLNQYPSYPDKGMLSGGQTQPKPHTYPITNGQSGGGLSGGGINDKNKQTAPLTTLYPAGSGLSGGQTQPTGVKPHTYPNTNGQSGGGLPGGGTNNKNRQTAPLTTLYPAGSGLSGGQTQPTGVKPHTYPNTNGQSGGGLSGGGTNNKNRQTAPLTTLYPAGSGLSGGQTQPTGAKPHTYPITNGQSGGGYKPSHSNSIPPKTNVVHKPVEPSYNDIYVRNHHTTNIYHNNIHTTNIHLYHYKPPKQVYYVHNGMQLHYPVYREILPEYVYEYRSSRSRFNVLLTGLALYNLGHVSKNRESLHYHNNYKPGQNEVCEFRVEYSMISYNEMNIDCRLITDFIWTIKHTKYEEIVWNPINDDVMDALDPQFNGKSLLVNDDMNCYMKYYDGYTGRKKYVSCKLLETYVKKSFNSASKIASSLLAILIPIVIAIINL